MPNRWRQRSAIGIPARDMPVELTVNVHGDGNGTIYFGYHSDGKLVQQWRDFQTGDNQLKITVPALLDDADVWLAVHRYEDYRRIYPMIRRRWC